MEFRNSPSESTLAEIDKVRAFIHKHAPQLTEQPGSTKWTDGHCVFVDNSETADQYIFMVGALKNGKVTWHMMPLYGLPEIQKRWADDIKPFVSGKSCIQFSKFDELPEPALMDIVKNGTPQFSDVLKAMAEKKRRK